MDPFIVTGVDFTSALYIRVLAEGRNTYSIVYRYAYSYVLTSVHAATVYLEVLNDLSEETFLQAFYDFSNRNSYHGS